MGQKKKIVAKKKVVKIKKVNNSKKVKPAIKKVIQKEEVSKQQIQPPVQNTSEVPIPVNSNLPKMVKFVDDSCYGVKFNALPECTPCFLKRSCQSTYQSQKKKQKQIQSGIVRKPAQKKYKMTEAYRPWR